MVNTSDVDREFDAAEKQLDLLALEIGYLAMAFNSLENTLDQVITEYIYDDMEDLGYAVIEGMTFQWKVNLLGRLYGFHLTSMRNSEFLAQLKDLKSALRNAAARRNEVIHAAWLEYEGRDGRVRTKKKSTDDGVHVIEKAITPQSIRTQTEYIESVEEQLSEFAENPAKWQEPPPMEG